jgi:tetratricopeptide (TPR) repeat protein
VAGAIERRSCGCRLKFVPESLQDGLRLYAQQRYDQAVTRFTAAAAAASPLREYGSYYAGVSELRLKRYESARRRFVELKDANGYIRQAAALGEAEADQGLLDYNAETKVYERLLKQKSIDEPAIWLSLATSSAAAGDRASRRRSVPPSLLRISHPRSGRAGPCPVGFDAGSAADRFREQALHAGTGPGRTDVRPSPIGDARTSFLRVQPFAKGDDSELIALRLAECDYFQG